MIRLSIYRGHPKSMENSAEVAQPGRALDPYVCMGAKLKTESSLVQTRPSAHFLFCQMRRVLAAFSKNYRKFTS